MSKTTKTYWNVLAEESVNEWEVYKLVDQLPHHPLACYIFSESTVIQQEIINNIQAGGACINNCVFHAGNHHLPFGGVGAYHGFDGFECFSHKKGVLKSTSWITR
ncbi:hypothetical protein [Methyloprofundus sp.]|uniref:hypothetical protein n=1 Tax=Methyloprofundus sp. TaxID=2020875 RepID=UPI003D0FDDF4